MNVEARLLTTDTARSIMEHNISNKPSIIPISKPHQADVKGKSCTHEHYDPEVTGMIKCMMPADGNPNKKHGWLCDEHYQKQQRAGKARYERPTPQPQSH